MMIPLFTGGGSLNTKTDPVRIPYDRESGVSDLAVAYNVVVEGSGRISRASGYQIVKDDKEFHSLFCDGGDCFVARGASLFQVLPDFTLKGIRSGLSFRRISFAQVANKTYYSNGLQTGVIENGASTPWGKDEYTGVDAATCFSGPVKAEHLAWAHSRMFFADGDVLWWSEPWQPGLINKAVNFSRLPGRIVMVKGVASGVFVSDKKKTYFLRGRDPHQFTLEVVADYPALEWGCATDYVDGVEMGLESPGLCAVWISAKGVCLGLASGQMINVNRNKIVYPDGITCGASCIRDFHFIHTVE